jgi:hypothetical protein
MSNKFFDHFLEPAGAAAKREWRGLLTGVILAAIFVYFVFGTEIGNYGNLGTYVGTYEVPIGSGVTIARNELRVRFSRQSFYCRGKDDEDTTWQYPLFEIYPANTGTDHYRFPRFLVGRRLGIDGQYFYYTIELIDLTCRNTDTTATFEVHKREYPETIKTDP